MRYARAYSCPGKYGYPGFCSGVLWGAVESWNIKLTGRSDRFVSHEDEAQRKKKVHKQD
jgi:hypothetical protein